MNIRKEIFQILLILNYVYRALFFKTKLYDTISSKKGMYSLPVPQFFAHDPKTLE